MNVLIMAVVLSMGLMGEPSCTLDETLNLLEAFQNACPTSSIYHVEQ